MSVMPCHLHPDYFADRCPHCENDSLRLDDNEYARHYNAGYRAGQSNAQVGIDLMLGQARAEIAAKIEAVPWHEDEAGAHVVYRWELLAALRGGDS